MDKIGEQIRNANNKLTNLINEVTNWLEETEPEEEDHDRL